MTIFVNLVTIVQLQSAIVPSNNSLICTSVLLGTDCTMAHLLWDTLSKQFQLTLLYLNYFAFTQ